MRRCAAKPWRTVEWTGASPKGFSSAALQGEGGILAAGLVPADDEERGIEGNKQAEVDMMKGKESDQLETGEQTLPGEQPRNEDLAALLEEMKAIRARVKGRVNIKELIEDRRSR
jgi:hypothetical protein